MPVNLNLWIIFFLPCYFKRRTKSRASAAPPLVVWQAGISLKPTGNRFQRRRLLVGSSFGFLSMIREQKKSWSPRDFVSIGVVQTRWHTRAAAESQCDSRKEGRLSSSRALVCCSLSFIFWEASRRKLMWLRPRRSARDSSSAPFLDSVLTPLTNGLLLKDTCVCFIFLCQVPWVVAHSDWNHIHVLCVCSFNCIINITFFFFFFSGRLAASCGAVASGSVICNISETLVLEAPLEDHRCIFKDPTFFSFFFWGQSQTKQNDLYK